MLRLALAMVLLAGSAQANLIVNVDNRGVEIRTRFVDSDGGSLVVEDHAEAPFFAESWSIHFDGHGGSSIDLDSTITLTEIRGVLAGRVGVDTATERSHLAAAGMHIYFEVDEATNSIWEDDGTTFERMLFPGEAYEIHARVHAFNETPTSTTSPIFDDLVSVRLVPEPGTALLLALGLGYSASIARRPAKKPATADHAAGDACPPSA